MEKTIDGGAIRELTPKQIRQNRSAQMTKCVGCGMTAAFINKDNPEPLCHTCDYAKFEEELEASAALEVEQEQEAWRQRIRNLEIKVFGAAQGD